MSFEIGNAFNTLKNVFELCFASAWGSHIVTRTQVILTCCPMPGGSSAHGFAFSSPGSFSLLRSLAITVPTSQTVCARSNLSPPPCLPSLCPFVIFVLPLSPLLALCLLFCLLALACSCCLAWFSSLKNIFTSPFTLRDSLETLLCRYAFRLSPDKRQWMTHTNRNEKCTKIHP